MATSGDKFSSIVLVSGLETLGFEKSIKNLIIKSDSHDEVLIKDFKVNEKNSEFVKLVGLKVYNNYKDMKSHSNIERAVGFAMIYEALRLISTNWAVYVELRYKLQNPLLQDQKESITTMNFPINLDYKTNAPTEAPNNFVWILVIFGSINIISIPIIIIVMSLIIFFVYKKLNKNKTEQFNVV